MGVVVTAGSVVGGTVGSVVGGTVTSVVGGTVTSVVGGGVGSVVGEAADDGADGSCGTTAAEGVSERAGGCGRCAVSVGSAPPPQDAASSAAVTTKAETRPA